MAAKVNVIVFLSVLAFAFAASQTVPIVIWHGMGDSCCNPLSMGSIKKLLEREVKGVYVRSLEIGDGIVEDTENGFLMNANDQISLVCSKLKNDSKLAAGYNSIGFSQGGQFLRAVAQRCPSPPMLNLISVGGQHQGVYGFPKCPGDNATLCNIVRQLLNYGAYVSFVQDHLVQAEYWQDPLNLEEYRKYSVFLADINQEQTVKPSYKENLLKLKNLVLIKFLQDTMVQPRESEWFGFYAPGQTKDILPMNQTKIWTEDRLGLQTLNSSGRLHFLSSDTDHLQFTETWFIENVVNKFLK
ncbi:palmitoyl-protein thioesterase 1-like [Littorina saxatilis]|uniref:Palmitoyl-protein thioesterase 1 n=1 Tax=Littorina saxatilis TaxID=31220 RepID=A0AAN9G9G4_9CAEN